MKQIPRHLLILLIPLVLCFIAPAAWAFCGFYVAKADASLYNQASQVILTRQGDRTVLTMANDYKGDVNDFALVVPVPVVLQEDQVNVGEPAIVQRLDSFSAPRLVEYFDPDPCDPIPEYEMQRAPSAALDEATAGGGANNALGVTVEASFSVGEYDIVILSAEESNGLETWLRQNGYNIPRGARELLRPYIRQGMKFFVAKVNLEELDHSGFQALRPLQMAYESPRFMLPIRLGMVNGEAAQDLLLYVLTPSGQVEVTNYRTVKVPSGMDLPVFVKDEFADTYRAIFDTAYQQAGRNVAFLEYAWDMSWCDPCAAEPLSTEELRQAGVFWATASEWGASEVFITRLHVRYTRDKFPEDLTFQATNNRQNFQGRYVLRHPFTGEATCPAGREYKASLPNRFEAEAQTLARLTGWDINDIRAKQPDDVDAEPIPWWRNLWPR